MIKILPLKDKQVLLELNEKNSLNAGLAFCLYDGDRVDGYILYNLNAERGEILKVEGNDKAYVDGLVRAVLASIYDFGVNKAIFAEQVDLNLLKSLSILSDGNEIISIRDLLYNCKSCVSKTKCANCGV